MGGISWMETKDFNKFETPCYVLDEKKLERNLEILSRVKKETGCKILMALNGFAMFSVFPLIRKYLDGVATSSLNEERLRFEEFGGSAKLTTRHAECGGEIHICSRHMWKRNLMN